MEQQDNRLSALIDKVIVDLISDKIVELLRCSGGEMAASVAANRTLGRVVQSATVHTTSAVKKLITQADIRLHCADIPLYIHEKTLITPLARDLIRQKGIRLIRQ
ncbi:hypothetical protein ACUHGC_00770 [Testudinibacter sp. P27/CKL/0425]